MSKTLGRILLATVALVATLALAGVAYADNPHFISASASIDTSNGTRL